MTGSLNPFNWQVYLLKRVSRLLSGSLFLVFLAIISAGCKPAAPSQSAQNPSALTPAPLATAQVDTPVFTEPLAEQNGTENAPDAQPSPTVPCKDNLTFKKDLTIPDGTELAPESTLDKRWEVENSGNCNWGPAYRVRLIAGSELGAQKEQALYPARSGTQAVIRIQFKAPAEPGTYRSAWQAIDPQGEPFGDPFFIEIVVKATEAATP